MRTGAKAPATVCLPRRRRVSFDQPQRCGGLDWEKKPWMSGRKSFSEISADLIQVMLFFSRSRHDSNAIEIEASRAVRLVFVRSDDVQPNTIRREPWPLCRGGGRANDECAVMREENHSLWETSSTTSNLKPRSAWRETPRAASPARTSQEDRALRPAERRRRERIALIQEFGGAAADLKQVAMEAIRRGMYSPRTNRGDVELCLIRTWKHRNRDYAR